MQAIGADIWKLHGKPLRLGGGVHMPLSSTVIRLPDRSLLVYSPVDIDDAQAAELTALGEVAHVVAPNLFHHLYVGKAAARWPRATLHAAPGLAAKRKDLAFHRELGRDLDPALRDAIDVVVIGGAPKINEAVLFHRPSGTLVCADFVFHVNAPANLMTRMVLAMMGVGGRELAQSRLWKLLARDRSRVRASIDRVLQWPIASISPVHGDAVTMDTAGLAPRLSRSYGGRVAPALAA
jgi:hypothetical protein